MPNTDDNQPKAQQAQQAQQSAQTTPVTGPTPPPSGTTPTPPMPPQGAPMGGYPPQGAPTGGFPPQGAYPPMGAYPPQYGYPPMGDMQGGYYPPQGAPQPPQPEDTTPANFQIGAKLPPQLRVKVPANALKFDQDYFLRLLAGSISLMKDEKKKIIETIPKLKQEQIDELIRIFEEEKEKFAALSKKHVPQLEKLADQHYKEWMDLESEFENDNKKKEDQSKADEIRKNLGL